MSSSGAATLVLADESWWLSDGIADRQARKERRTADRLETGRIQACVHSFVPPRARNRAVCCCRAGTRRQSLHGWFHQATVAVVKAKVTAPEQIQLIIRAICAKQHIACAICVGGANGSRWIRVATLGKLINVGVWTCVDGRAHVQTRQDCCSHRCLIYWLLGQPDAPCLELRSHRIRMRHEWCKVAQQAQQLLTSNTLRPFVPFR